MPRCPHRKRFSGGHHHSQTPSAAANTSHESGSTQSSELGQPDVDQNVSPVEGRSYVHQSQLSPVPGPSTISMVPCQTPGLEIIRPVCEEENSDAQPVISFSRITEVGSSLVGETLSQNVDVPTTIGNQDRNTIDSSRNVSPIINPFYVSEPAFVDNPPIVNNSDIGMEIHDIEETISPDRTHNENLPSMNEGISDMEIQQAIMDFQQEISTVSVEITQRDTHRSAASRRDQQENHLGTLTQSCQFCTAISFPSEFISSNVCCATGKVQLPSPSPLPSALEELFTGNDRMARNFRRYVLRYNSNMAFASIGATIANVPGHGPPCYKIQGQIYHRIADINLSEEHPRYGQIFFLDFDAAIEARRNVDGHGDNDIYRILERILRTDNPFVGLYMQLRDVANDRRTPAETLYLQLKYDRSSDDQRYVLPTANQVGGIFDVEESGIPNRDRSVCVHLRRQNGEGGVRLQNISPMDPNCDPLCYPLLFPRGEQGYRIDIPQRNNSNRRVTALQYFGYRMSIRQEDFNRYLDSGKLSQQYIVDSYVKIESNNLTYLRMNQSSLRAERYRGLIDFMTGDGPNNIETLGRMVILPSTFQGSPRNYYQNYQDSMAVVAKYGKPDLFITFTCNPNWREIRENLKPFQAANDRPDLTVRVFRCKLKELMKDICDRHVFGVPVAHLHVIEFQKRGLPHAHILIILASRDKFNTASDVDLFVSAELPDPNEESELYALCSLHMLHGPCNELNPTNVCMQSGQCTKKYPKPLCAETILNNNGYPQYRRRDSGFVANVRGAELNNGWVVPYNPWLLRKYNAHINVEVCSSLKSVKYLYKYVYKGYDCATAEIRRDNVIHLDEITQFIDTRYVSAPEACWRIFQFKMHSQSHVVYRLPVHLPDQQNVYFRPGEENSALNRQGTMLTAYFELNRININARNYYYKEIPEHYVYNKRDRRWTVRQRRHRLVTRMYIVNPRETEKYALRILLLHVKGATSFEDLRTVNGVGCESFAEAARRLHLFDNDDEWRNCLREVAHFRSARQLRSLFAQILLFCVVSNASALWNEFMDSMIEDHLRLFDRERSISKALGHISSILRHSGKGLGDFGLPEVEGVDEHIEENLIDMDAERLEYMRCEALLNTEQQCVYNEILQAINNEDYHERLFALMGPAGSGKTWIYNTLIGRLRAENLGVVPVATTGIAAILLKGGRTAHSTFKLPVPLTETSVSNMSGQDEDARKIRESRLIIWDEISMTSKYGLLALDRLLRDMCRRNDPFGGKVLLIGGDFRQCLPVVRGGNRVRIVEECVKSCSLWPRFKTLQLTSNMRANPEEIEFKNWLMMLGNGDLAIDCELRGLPENYFMIPSDCLVENVVEAMYGNIDEFNVNINDRAILCPTNEACDEINNIVLEKMANVRAKVYTSADSIETEDDEELLNYPMEYLNSLRPSGMPPHKLTLKEGTVIMLLRNLNVSEGLCNGTRLQVVDMLEHTIVANIITGIRSGQRAFIPRIDLCPSDTGLPFKMKRRQFPVVPAFAMTINKSQGQTFDQVGLYLNNPVFAHGQMYVAFSRVRHFGAIKVQIQESRSQGRLLQDESVFTKNVVYQNVLN